ncbi:FHA domain-containing protein [Aliiruegeria lutimaris]|uniref:FHA domain-containing protein n=1 Tax=Aliiruegeria lutimaris TaxID=571298 RepID=A0A1G8VY88_9RHOB|nr:FHA domain-containing protein [Aliiruegeria lutimaris]SDJ70797.1 FHA domain-containing protein [Aliiruegeria lutimaris]
MKFFRRKHSASAAASASNGPVAAEEPSELPPDMLVGESYEDPGLSEREYDAQFRSLSMDSHGSIARPRVEGSETDTTLPAPRAEISTVDAPARRRIWDIEAERQVALARARIAQFSQAGLAPAGTAPSGQRAKTRLLGFQAADLAQTDPFSAAARPGPRAERCFPVGWLVVVEGPGRGACFTLTNGVSSIGRGEDQSVCLDFGDGSISRSNHAAIAYDDDTNCFFLGQGGKSNIVRLNGRPVLSTEDLSHGDRIKIGETSLQFVAFCGESFSWSVTQEGAEGKNAVHR